MPEQLRSNIPDQPWTLVGEPTSRPDGTTIRVRRYSNGDVAVDDILPNGGSSSLSYTHDDIVILGDGDYNRGLARVGHEHYQGDHDEMLDVSIRMQEQLNNYYCN